MTTRLLPIASLLISLTFSLTACNPAATIIVQSPDVLEEISDCDVDVMYTLVGNFDDTPEVTVNFVNVDDLATEGPAGVFHMTLGPDEVVPGQNLLLIKATRTIDGEVLTQGVTFTYAPKASAFQITDPGDLITGPLAHSRVGDYMLQSCQARFVIQDVSQRDLYSVGQYGGNLIDAELIGSPGLDNFLEIQPMINVETVINTILAVIVNDGADGQPAVIRTCGQDDLLDFVNPSSQVLDVGLPFPAVLNDNNQPVFACTDYSLSPVDSHIKMETTITNLSGLPIDVLSGDWMNQGGELHVAQTPNIGVGPALTNDLGSMSFFGFGEAVGVDYSYLATPPVATPGSYVVISGVTVILYSSNVLLALLGVDAGVTIGAGQSHIMTRYIGVGDGSASGAVDLEIAIKGLASASIDGCVTVDGAPAPGAKVTVGTFDVLDDITSMVAHFVTDADGCYAGSLPVPTSPITYGVVAARPGTPYQGGLATPQVNDLVFNAGDSQSLDIDLPATGSLQVTTTNAASAPLPTRVTVVGFDPSPPILLEGPSLPGFGGSTLGLFDDPDDPIPFGVVNAAHTGADGIVSFDLEPGSYRVVVSRGTEYSISDTVAVITAGNQTQIAAQIAQVLDTDGFVSSDFHVHGINSADSRISHFNRVEGYAGEGVDNIVMTDHHVHTDLDPMIASLGLGAWVSSTIGEEITTFDYGHFNSYPRTVDNTRISLGSTDWAVAAPPGLEFPSQGAYNATPAEIFTLATTDSTSTVDTTVQINHISSHFQPLKINTALVPPADGLSVAERLERRLDEPLATNLFFPFPALELWNGNSRGAQNSFLNDRMGIWFNLLNQGIETTFIADTDSHRFVNLNMAGASTWTAAAPGSDAPGTVDGGEVANMIDSGRAVGGQGVFVTTRLRATDGSGDEADLTHLGVTHMTDAAGNVELDIRIQAPVWAAFDEVQIYTNAVTTVVDAAEPYLYGATPDMQLFEGDCDETTTGDGDYDVSLIVVDGAVAGADRLEANLTIPFNGLTEDTWFVVVVKGTDGLCPAMFPVYPANLDSASNLTAADLMDGNVGETGVLSLGATNALYFDAP
jgi:hypothetical protein